NPNVVTWSDASDGSDTRNINVSTEDQFGSLNLADGRHLHAAPAYYPLQEGPVIYAPGTVVLIVDTDNSDGTIGIGIARQFDDNIVYPNAIGAGGVYRSTILTDGPLADQFFGAHSLPGADSIKEARVAIELKFDGTYNI